MAASKLTWRPKMLAATQKMPSSRNLSTFYPSTLQEFNVGALALYIHLVVFLDPRSVPYCNYIFIENLSMSNFRCTYIFHVQGVPKEHKYNNLNALD